MSAPNATLTTIESKRRHGLNIVIICLIYLMIQWFFIAFSIYSMDDLWLAYHTYQYKKGLPYRDFLPYKSVLGYYFFLFPLSLSHEVLTPLLYTKAWITGLNVLFLSLSSYYLHRFFSQKSILISLILLLSTPIFLRYSSEIRVDLLAYWFCLISVLFLFDKKYVLTGITLGLGFLISQKAVWYVVATNCGLIGQWLFHTRNEPISKKRLYRNSRGPTSRGLSAGSRKVVRSLDSADKPRNVGSFLLEQTLAIPIEPKKIISLNAGMLLTILLYVLFWSYFANLSTVLTSLFYEPYFISSFDYYTKQRTIFWTIFLYPHYGIIFLSLLAFISLFFLPAKNKPFILIYTAVILLFLASCKQPFCYFPLAAFPALFILLSSFFSTYYDSIHTRYFPSNQRGNRLLLWSIYATLFFLGMILPLTHFIMQLPKYDGRYQKSMIHLAATLLQNKDGYIAGVPLLLNVEQPVPGLVHLTKSSLEYLSYPSNQLHAMQTLSSLYFSPDNVQDIIKSIKKAPIKLYVDNNRFHFLPRKLRHYLHTQYHHFWGSIYLYAPTVRAGHHVFSLKFESLYRVKASHTISLDHHLLAPNTIIYLTKQHHLSESKDAYRLELVPQHIENLEPSHQKNDWKSTIC